MKTARLNKPEPVERSPLKITELPRPIAGPGQLLLRVRACGLCHTDLHTIEGDIVPPHYPIIPGHQVVAIIEELGDGVEGWDDGDRVGVPWLYRACGTCDHCARGDENLCDRAQFTGFHVDGGYAEFMVADARYVLPLPDGLGDEEVAPLLCAGIIGYRSLHKSDLHPGERLGLVGFGASAHLAIQVATYWDCEVYVFTRSESHRQLARDLGAVWVGGSEDRAPVPLDRAILFAPVGDLVPVTLEKIRPGGTLAINAIHLSSIPEMEYRVIYGERTLRSVANATYRDGVEFLRLATEIPVKVSTRKYALEEANQALNDLKNSRIDGAGVLLP
ncbi:MAG: alcohol dehydrogenase [Anaerolineae bacterium SM23_ 63]|nr:MAG: alcohol dehydrogenase [Anaerolineae bacterium SM23_ 63]HEY46247.1 zinc-dependent alcohol dehydrogenase family protein [Anaerolineae bacterium]